VFIPISEFNKKQPSFSAAIVNVENETFKELGEFDTYAQVLPHVSSKINLKSKSKLNNKEYLEKIKEYLHMESKIKTGGKKQSKRKPKKRRNGKSRRVKK
jgi:hypothetical protein